MDWLIRKYEGFSSKPYLCPAQVATIGYGTTRYPDGTKVSMADEPITEEQASAYLNSYIINTILPYLKDLDLTDNQRTALVSLIYNIGWGAFAKSKCYKAIKAKDWGTAYKEWDWITGSGKVLNGLIKRREEERFLFFMDI
jgi:lysozyme